jgi:hypothetical protein
MVWKNASFTGCGKTPVSYQGIALAIPQIHLKSDAPLGALQRLRCASCTVDEFFRACLGMPPVHRQQRAFRRWPQWKDADPDVPHPEDPGQ